MLALVLIHCRSTCVVLSLSVKNKKKEKKHIILRDLIQAYLSQVRLADGFGCRQTDSEQQLIDCYLKLPMCTNCSSDSGCNPTKDLNSQSQSVSPPVCLYFKDKNLIPGFWAV